MTAQRLPCRGKILVIDDDEGMVDTLRRLLERRFDVTLTTRAMQALQWINLGSRYDVILCDLLMPELTGMDLHDVLTQAAPDQANRMVFVTGGACTPRAREFLQRISNPHLEKPFDFARLAILINARLHKPLPIPP